MSYVSAATRLVVVVSALGLVAVGCTSISVEPSCPASLRVGESGTIAANEQNPGAIARYQWEVFPEDAGTLDSPNASSTTFVAAKEGQARFRITAADGLYQVISECETVILASGVEVSLTSDRTAAAINETVTLTCTSIGEVEAESLTIVQIDGQRVELTQDAGVGTFTPDALDERTFVCVGETASGASGESAQVTIGESDQVIDDNSNDNTTDDNTNDNTTDDNSNDNTIDDNTNDNTDDGNTNDNVRPTRPDDDRDSDGR